MYYTLKANCCSCDCEPMVIARYNIHGAYPERSSWDLTPYQGEGIGAYCGKWQIMEVSYGLIYASGEIDEKGRLVGLPDQVSSNYQYTGYLELQQACCPNHKACCDAWEIEWP